VRWSIKLFNPLR